MNRWNLYEMLKTNEVISNKEISKIENMNPEELREGVIEFILSKNKQNEGSHRKSKSGDFLTFEEY